MIAAASRAGSWWWALAGSTRSSSTSAGGGCADRRPAQLHHLAVPALWGDRVEAVVGQHQVGQVPRSVALEGVEMVGQVEAAGLTGLRGHVADEHHQRPRGRDRLADARDEERREDAREQAARTDHDELSLAQRAERVLRRLDIVRRHPHPVHPVGARDPTLADHLGAVVEPRVERDRRARRGNHATADREHAVHLADRLLEVTLLQLDERGQQQVADRVAAERRHGALALDPGVAEQPGAVALHRTDRRRAQTREPVLEQPSHQWLGIGEGHDAVAQVADRRDPELGSEHAGRAAIVGDGDHRGEVRRVLLETTQQRRQARSATDRHHPRSACQEALLVDHLDHRLVLVPERGMGLPGRG